jgi:hypothetical protein
MNLFGISQHCIPLSTIRGGGTTAGTGERCGFGKRVSTAAVCIVVVWTTSFEALFSKGKGWWVVVRTFNGGIIFVDEVTLNELNRQARLADATSTNNDKLVFS